jgi:hypothetical protein
MRQDLVDRVRALVGDGDDSFVIAQLARAQDDLSYGNARLRPAAAILPRASVPSPDDELVVRLAARRILAVSGIADMHAAHAEAELAPAADRSVAAVTRGYSGYSFGSRCDLPRENGQ